MIEQYNKKLPFNIAHECAGSLIKDDLTTDNLHMAIEHSVISPTEIRGNILGDYNTYEKIAPIFERQGVISIYAEDDFTIIKSDEVLIRSISKNPAANDIKQVVPRKTAELEIYNIVYRYKVKGTKEKRKITYFLSHIKNISYIFRWRYKRFKRKPLEINKDKDYLGKFDIFEVYVEENEFHDDYGEEAQLERRIVSLQFVTDVTEITDEEFVEKTKKIVNDILLLASFICKHWIRWYGYILNTSGFEERFYQVMSKTSDHKIVDDEIVIKLYDTKRYLRKAFKMLRKLDGQQLNIRKPIIYIINGNEARFLEAQFTTTFLALEKLKDVYSIKKKIDSNLKEKEFKKLRSKLSKLIKCEIKNPLNIIDKLPELNRPPIQFVVNKLLDKYRVEWKDMYPPGSKLTIFKTRNSLFHSSRHPEPEIITKELIRLQAILSRIILRMLGWDDTSEVIDKHYYGFLVK